MATHEFGILEEFDESAVYKDYEPEKYKCISIDDEYIEYIVKYLGNLNTYYFEYNQKEYGLNYYGITIIPPKSIMYLYDIVVTANRFKKSHQLAELCLLLMDAKIKNKHIIHFGI